MSQSANAPANAPQTAMANQGSAEKRADCARSSPKTCLKYEGIQANRMKYPQLFTKFAKTHAKTGGAENKRAAETFFSRADESLVVSEDVDLLCASTALTFTTAPPSSISASSSAFTRRSESASLGYAVAAANQTTAQTKPATPKTRNGADTPPATSIAGAASRPTTLPLWNPVMHAATARLRSCFGTHRAVMLFMHGKATPSPRPMTARHRSSAGSDAAAAKGVRAVATDHVAMPARSTFLPPILSASTPPRSGVRVYPHRNELCTKPSVSAPQPCAAARGTPATDMITRSALHSNSASATRDTTAKR
mmetsp:Transcript_7162/g.30512  ORF Transcript_7162/g.30512 Transcript_7162/m.30512 type:complete len:309 (-) Transcript_7162:175-1101(-)